MRIFLRCFVALYATAGIIGGTVLLGTWGYMTAVFAAGGDGSGSDISSEIYKAWSIGVAVWTLPTLAFVFMLLAALNWLKGIMHSIGYWFVLICLIAETGAFFLLYFNNKPMFKWFGLPSLLTAFLWGIAFRKSCVKNDEH